MKRFLLDMDPGVDDALAILLAVSSGEADIVGIGSSCGNVGARPSALNVLKVLDAAGVAPQFPVCVGAPMPLSGWPPGDKPDAESIHGPGGLGPNSQPDPKPERLSSKHAVDLIVETYAQPSDVTLVVTGPLTNVAKALRQAGHIERNIPRIVFMGGAYTVPGNIAPYGEFNIWMDPVAAAEVMASEIPMTIVGLDVALQCPLSLADIEDRLCPDQWPLGRFIREITSHYMAFYKKNEDFAGCYMHDPLAMATAIWPEFVETEPFHVQVITDSGSPVRGMIVLDRRARRDQKKEPKKDIALRVDNTRFSQVLLDTLGPGNE